MLANARILATLNHKFGPNSYWWQQDNAPAHQPAKELIAKHCKCLDWPPHSPDLSPIEHMWAAIKRKLKGKKFANAKELFAAVSREWDAISVNIVQNLYSSFPARCKVCIELNGGCLNQHWTRVRELHKQDEGHDGH
jgi:hypothetical protein